MVSVADHKADGVTYKCLCGRKANALSVHARDENVLAMNRGSESLCDFRSFSICIEICVRSFCHGDCLAGLDDLESPGWMELAAIFTTVTRYPYM
jgi:hypothetical protein